MQSSSRDRCGLVLLALCLALVSCAFPAGALQADYWVAENASTYHAVFMLENVTTYAWWDLGLLGERIPLLVGNITLLNRDGSCRPCPYNRTNVNEITFEKGDYFLSFDGEIHNNQLLAEFETSSAVSVHLPEGLDIRNPLLGAISAGGSVSEEGTGVVIRWNATQAIDCRFYDPFREILLTSFLTFWGVIAVILLFPFLMMSRKKE
ncbi:MAG: DUF5803 family protein [Methanomicrobiales archaeon]|nr:DUF5803 family protein [Methanomicrobiales archaeon]